MIRVPSIFLLLLLYNMIGRYDAAVTLVAQYGSNNSHDDTEQNKVKSLVLNLSALASKKKFYNSSVGDNSRKIYGLFQCRQDLDSEICAECIQDAQLTLLRNSTEAVVWYYECMLSYSYRPMFPIDTTTPFASSQDRVQDYSVSDPNQFQVLSDTIAQVIDNATNSQSPMYFAVLKATSKWYTLAQCIPVISGSDCKKCLQIAVDKMPQCCINLQYAMVFLPSCQLRYGDSRFYNNLPHPSRSRSWRIAILVVVIVGIGILVCFSIYMRARLRKAKATQKDDIMVVESLKFSFKSIQAATKNFSPDGILGKGGFGEVYKGKLATGQDVAVKRLSKNSGQGFLEFKNEVLLIAKLQHKNLVRLLGYCNLAKENILIYEFLCNSSLDRFLYDIICVTNLIANPKMRVSLNWETRFKIIIGIARGLQYLHEDSRLKIIHRDLKASNILLDEDMNPKISDFGIAKLLDLNQVEGDTNRIMGTYGYMAPEYAMAGQFSDKSDIYSFGVMVLEIISGESSCVNPPLQQQQQPPTLKEGLLPRAWRLWNEGRMVDLVDSLLGNDFSSEEVKIAHHIGLLCVQEDATNRPRMIPIVTALNGNSITLPLPTQPHFLTVDVLDGCTDYYSMEVDGGIHLDG